MSKIYIDYNSRTLVFENNGIAFSQMGIAKEILDLIVNQQDKIDKTIKYIKRESFYDESGKEVMDEPNKLLKILGGKE